MGRGPDPTPRIEDERSEILRMIAELRTRPRPSRATGGRLEPSTRSGNPQLRASREVRISRAPAPLALAPRAMSAPVAVHTEREVRPVPRNGSQVDAALVTAVERIGERLDRVEHQLAQLAERPLAPARSLQPSPSSYAMAGCLRRDLLGDILQLLSSNQMSGKFVVMNGGSKSVLWFDEGCICHTEVAGLEGEAAFFAVFASTEGEYYFEETTDLPEERTITSSTQFLILEALRQIDENEAE